MNLKSANRSIKRWPGWMVLALATFVLLAVGIAAENGPQTQQDRIDAISKRIACPTCQGESVYVSRASSAESIRNEIARQVGTGQLSDDEIVAYLEDSFGGNVLLVPRSTGVDALVWALPVAVAVAAIAGLAVAFRRWRSQSLLVATDDDEAIVADLRKEVP
jgi:cytochrome c-type biogenesis protein CcmH